jgi:hypothetical protein
MCDSSDFVRILENHSHVVVGGFEGSSYHDSLFPLLRDERERLEEAVDEFTVVTKALYKDKLRWTRQHEELEKALVAMHTEARESKRKHAAQKLKAVLRRLDVHETFIGSMAATIRGRSAVRLQRVCRGMRGRYVASIRKAEAAIEKAERERISSILMQACMRGVLARMVDHDNKEEVDRERMAILIQRNYRRHRFFSLIFQRGTKLMRRRKAQREYARRMNAHRIFSHTKIQSIGRMWLARRKRETNRVNRDHDAAMTIEAFLCEALARRRKTIANIKGSFHPKLLTIMSMLQNDNTVNGRRAPRRNRNRTASTDSVSVDAAAASRRRLSSVESMDADHFVNLWETVLAEIENFYPPSDNSLHLYFAGSFPQQAVKKPPPVSKTGALDCQSSVDISLDEVAASAALLRFSVSTCAAQAPTLSFWRFLAKVNQDYWRCDLVREKQEERMMLVSFLEYFLGEAEANIAAISNVRNSRPPVARFATKASEEKMESVQRLFHAAAARPRTSDSGGGKARGRETTLYTVTNNDTTTRERTVTGKRRPRTSGTGGTRRPLSTTHAHSTGVSSMTGRPRTTEAQRRPTPSQWPAAGGGGEGTQQVSETDVDSYAAPPYFRWVSPQELCPGCFCFLDLNSVGYCNHCDLEPNCLREIHRFNRNGLARITHSVNDVFEPLDLFLMHVGFRVQVPCQHKRRSLPKQRVWDECTKLSLDWVQRFKQIGICTVSDLAKAALPDLKAGNQQLSVSGYHDIDEMEPKATRLDTIVENLGMPPALATYITNFLLLLDECITRIPTRGSNAIGVRSVYHSPHPVEFDALMDTYDGFTQPNAAPYTPADLNEALAATSAQYTFGTAGSSLEQSGRQTWSRGKQQTAPPNLQMNGICDVGNGQERGAHTPGPGPSDARRGYGYRHEMGKEGGSNNPGSGAGTEGGVEKRQIHTAPSQIGLQRRTAGRKDGGDGEDGGGGNQLNASASGGGSGSSSNKGPDIWVNWENDDSVPFTANHIPEDSHPHHPQHSPMGSPFHAAGGGVGFASSSSAASLPHIHPGSPCPIPQTVTGGGGIVFYMDAAVSRSGSADGLRVTNNPGVTNTSGTTLRRHNKKKNGIMMRSSKHKNGCVTPGSRHGRRQPKKLDMQSIQHLSNAEINDAYAQVTQQLKAKQNARLGGSAGSATSRPHTSGTEGDTVFFSPANQGGLDLSLKLCDRS